VQGKAELGEVDDRRQEREPAAPEPHLGDARNQHAEALISTVRQFAPPPLLEGGVEVYSILTAITALRAATPEYLANPQVDARYEEAARWACPNFGPLIWWSSG
jgi:hypothetical protein